MLREGKSLNLGRQKERLIDIRSKWGPWIILCAIVILGSVLRIYGLTKQSLWVDEAFSILTAEKGFRGIIFDLKDHSVHPPLHYFMLYGWMKLFGAGEQSIRAFPCIFGILIIPAIYYIGSSLFGRRVGLISAFIASISQFHVKYSQEVRMYSVLILLGLLSTYFLYKAATTDTKRSWTLYTLCTILTIYTHNYGIFITISGFIFLLIYATTQDTAWRRLLIVESIIGILYLPWLLLFIMGHGGVSAIVGRMPQAWQYYAFRTLNQTLYTYKYGILIAVSGAVVFSAVYVITRDMRWRRFLIAHCIIAILYLPWVPIPVRQFRSPGIGWVPQNRLYINIYETFKTYSSLSFNTFTPGINSFIVCLGLAVFSYCFLTGIFSIKRYKKILVPYIERNKELLLLLCYLFVTLGIPILISIRKPIYVPSRYSIAAWPAFPLILGIGVSKIRNLYTSLMVLVIIIFVSSASLYWHHFVWIKSYDRSIANFIDLEATENDLIVFVPAWTDKAIIYYLRTPLKHLGYPWPSTRELPDKQNKSPRKPNTMVDLARSRFEDSAGRMFFVYATWKLDLAVVKRLFDENFTKIRSKSYGDTEIVIYTNTENSPADH